MDLFVNHPNADVGENVYLDSGLAVGPRPTGRRVGRKDASCRHAGPGTPAGHRGQLGCLPLEVPDGDA